MARIFGIISIIAFSAASGSFFLAAFFWFRFDIWKVMGDLSGRTAKKSIEQMRRANARRGKNFYGMSPETANRRSVTEPESFQILQSIVLVHTNEEISCPFHRWN